MNLTYKSTDDAYIEFNSKPAVDSIQVEEDIIFDLDENDEVIGIEILCVKNKTPEQIKKIYQYTEYPIKGEYIQELKEVFRKFQLYSV